MGLEKGQGQRAQLINFDMDPTRKSGTGEDQQAGHEGPWHDLTPLLRNRVPLRPRSSDRRQSFVYQLVLD
jgi:hypothetical protein